MCDPYLDPSKTALPADWAIRRALELGASEMYSPDWYHNPKASITLEAIKQRPDHGIAFRVTAFARYIESHESPPVPEEVLFCRRIFAAFCSGLSATQYNTGEKDQHPSFKKSVVEMRKILDEKEVMK